MGDIASLRKQLQARQTTAGALGTDDFEFCLDVAALKELQELGDEPQDQPEPSEAAGKARLGRGKAAAGEDDVHNPEQDRIAELEERVKAATVRVVFRALPAPQYQAIVNQFPTAEQEPAQMDAFLDAVASDSLHQVWQAGEQLPGLLEWSELKAAMGYGEWDMATTKAFSLNRRALDVDTPFSRQRSGRTRPR